MLGQCRLAKANRILYRGHGPFSLVQFAQDHQPLAVGQCFEESFGLGGLGGEFF